MCQDRHFKRVCIIILLKSFLHNDYYVLESANDSPRNTCGQAAEKTFWEWGNDSWCEATGNCEFRALRWILFSNAF